MEPVFAKGLSYKSVMETLCGERGLDSDEEMDDEVLKTFEEGCGDDIEDEPEDGGVDIGEVIKEMAEDDFFVRNF